MRTAAAAERVARAAHRSALKSVRAIPNPRSEDRRPKETRRPRSELIATQAEQQPIESGHFRNSDFGLLSGFGLRSSDFRAAEHDLPSTGRTLEQPWPRPLRLVLTFPTSRPPDIASNFQGVSIFLRNEHVLCYCVLRARQSDPIPYNLPPRTLTTLATVPDSSHGTAIAP